MAVFPLFAKVRCPRLAPRFHAIMRAQVWKGLTVNFERLILRGYYLITYKHHNKRTKVNLHLYCSELLSMLNVHLIDSLRRRCDFQITNSKSSDKNFGSSPIQTTLWRTCSGVCFANIHGVVYVCSSMLLFALSRACVVDVLKLFK